MQLLIIVISSVIYLLAIPRVGRLIVRMPNFPNFIARNIFLAQNKSTFKLAYVVALAKLITIAYKNVIIGSVVAKIHAVQVAYVLLFCYDFLALVVQNQWFRAQKCPFGESRHPKT